MKMTHSKMRIVVVDGILKMHQTYQSYFTHSADYELKACYTSFHDVLKHFGKDNPQILISEVSLQGISGIDGIERIKKKDPDIKIIVISHDTDFNTIKKAFKKGANGYLTKPVSQLRLLQALSSVQKDGAALSHDVAQKVIAMFRKTQYASLSKRENEIVEYLGQGATYKRIAERLFVTPSTVNFHIQNIYLKLNVNNKSEALEKLRMLQAS